jgi:hypothetical protein
MGYIPQTAKISGDRCGGLVAAAVLVVGVMRMQGTLGDCCSVRYEPPHGTASCCVAACLLRSTCESQPPTD